MCFDKETMDTDDIQCKDCIQNALSNEYLPLKMNRNAIIAFQPRIVSLVLHTLTTKGQYNTDTKNNFIAVSVRCSGIHFLGQEKERIPVSIVIVSVYMCCYTGCVQISKIDGIS